jgi:hypothetical protein
MPSIIAPLTHDGAIVEVLVGVSHHRAMMLQARQLPIPEPIRLRLLVDTGASCTNIAQGCLDALGSESTGSTQIHTASSGTTPVDCDEYDVSMVFPDSLPAPWGIASLTVIECLPLDGPIDGLLGRDILNGAILTYNPFANVVTISF